MSHILHLISDSTGETVTRIAAAATGLFPDHQIQNRLHVFVRNEANVRATIAAIEAEPGLVVVTMANPDLRARIVAEARKLGVEIVTVMQPIVQAMEKFLDAPSQPLMGGQYSIDDFYFRRVDAIDYAIAHDDGAMGDRLARADVILTGVSRTSKTPTCIYLAVRGVKAANLPLVPDVDPPPSFFAAIEQGVPVVALTASPNRLAQIRSHRLEVIGGSANEDYAALDQIRREVADARLLFERIGAPIIDVTRRSIEETAAAIMAILRERGAI